MLKNFISVSIISILAVSCSTKKTTVLQENVSNVVIKKTPLYERVALDVANFKFDSYKLQLTKYGKSLNNAINEIKERAKTIKSVKITGHCDERGSNEYNDKLGLKRANQVSSYIKSKLGTEFLSENSLDIKIRSEGKRNPLVKSAITESEHAKNRRVTVTLKITK